MQEFIEQQRKMQLQIKQELEQAERTNDDVLAS